MAIKVTVNTTDTSEITYPRVCCLIEDPRIIVLFTANGRGTCLAPATHNSFGKETTGWDSPSKWKPVCITIDSTQGT